MENILPTSIQAPSYANQLLDLASRSALGAVTGALASKFLLPLAVEQGAIIGAAVTTASALIQKAVLYLTNQEEEEHTRIYKVLITTTSLAAIFFAATHVAAAPLLGRIGLELSKKTVLTLCASSLLTELVFNIKETKSTREKVADLPIDQFINIYSNRDQYKLTEKIEQALDKRAQQEKLNFEQWPQSVEEMQNASDNQIKVMFLGSRFPLNQEIREVFHQRVMSLNLCFNLPKNENDVKKMSLSQLVWAFDHYCFRATSPYMMPKDKMSVEVRKAFDCRLKEEKLFAIPTNVKAVEDMNQTQINYAYFNYDEVMAEITDPQIKHALNQKIAQFLPNNWVAKPKSKADVNNLSILGLYYCHKHYRFFAKNQIETITALNVRYKQLGLVERPIPPNISTNFSSVCLKDKIKKIWQNKLVFFGKLTLLGLPVASYFYYSYNNFNNLDNQAIN